MDTRYKHQKLKVAKWKGWKMMLLYKCNQGRNEHDYNIYVKQQHCLVMVEDHKFCFIKVQCWRFDLGWKFPCKSSSNCCMKPFPFFVLQCNLFYCWWLNTHDPKFNLWKQVAHLLFMSHIQSCIQAKINKVFL